MAISMMLGDKRKLVIADNPKVVEVRIPSPLLPKKPESQIEVLLTEGFVI